MQYLSNFKHASTINYKILLTIYNIIYIGENLLQQIFYVIFKNTFYYLKEKSNRNEFSPLATTNLSRYYFSTFNTRSPLIRRSRPRGGNSVSTIEIIWTLRRLSVHLCSINADEDAIIGGRERERAAVRRAQKGSERDAAISDVIDTCMDQETEPGAPILRRVGG